MLSLFSSSPSRRLDRYGRVIDIDDLIDTRDLKLRSCNQTLETVWYDDPIRPISWEEYETIQSKASDLSDDTQRTWRSSESSASERLILSSLGIEFISRGSGSNNEKSTNHRPPFEVLEVTASGPASVSSASSTSSEQLPPPASNKSLLVEIEESSISSLKPLYKPLPSNLLAEIMERPPSATKTTEFVLPKDLPQEIMQQPIRASSPELLKPLPGPILADISKHPSLKSLALPEPPVAPPTRSKASDDDRYDEEHVLALKHRCEYLTTLTNAMSKKLIDLSADKKEEIKTEKALLKKEREHKKVQRDNRILKYQKMILKLEQEHKEQFDQVKTQMKTLESQLQQRHQKEIEELKGDMKHLEDQLRQHRTETIPSTMPPIFSVSMPTPATPRTSLRVSTAQEVVGISPLRLGSFADSEDNSSSASSLVLHSPAHRGSSYMDSFVMPAKMSIMSSYIKQQQQWDMEESTPSLTATSSTTSSAVTPTTHDSIHNSCDSMTMSHVPSRASLWSSASSRGSFSMSATILETNKYFPAMLSAVAHREDHVEEQQGLEGFEELEEL
jgi:hypothetical protein